MEQDALGKLLHQISVNNKKQVDQRMKHLDLSMTQGLTLIMLEEEEGHQLTIKTLEKRFETAQPTTLGVVNRLEQKNLVTSYINDKRKKVVKITKEGLDMVDSIKIYIQEVEAIFFQNFSEGERILFMELLQKSKENIMQYHTINGEQEMEKENER